MTLDDLLHEIEDVICRQTADEAVETMELLLAVLHVRAGKKYHRPTHDRPVAGYSAPGGVSYDMSGLVITSPNPWHDLG